MTINIAFADDGHRYSAPNQEVSRIRAIEERAYLADTGPKANAQFVAHARADMLFLVKVIDGYAGTRSDWDDKVDDLNAAISVLEDRLRETEAELERERSETADLRGKVDRVFSMLVERGIDRGLAESVARSLKASAHAPKRKPARRPRGRRSNDVPSGPKSSPGSAER